MVKFTRGVSYPATGQMSETSKVLTIAAAIYALFLPTAFFVGRLYTPIMRPDGSTIESIGKIYFDHPDHYYTRLYVFNQARFPDISGVSVYEDLTPLSDFNFAPDDGSYVVRFKASDDSDARTNGRKYWVVAR